MMVTHSQSHHHSGEYKQWVASRVAVVGTRLTVVGGQPPTGHLANLRKVVLTPAGRRPASPMPEPNPHLISALNSDGSRMV